jgi:hypothetical protein
MFVHVVNFWLKPNLTDSEKAQFLAGLKSLSTIESLTSFNIGVPAATDRPVIDRSYDYCLLTTFANAAGHDIYQPHPVHQAFVETCKHLWDRVLIYDSESI